MTCKTFLFCLCSIIIMVFPNFVYSACVSNIVRPGDPVIVRINNPEKPPNAIAGKLWWYDKEKIYIRQIVLYNQIAKDLITKEIYKYVMGLCPQKYEGIENYGYKMWPESNETFDFSKFKD